MTSRLLSSALLVPFLATLVSCDPPAEVKKEAASLRRVVLAEVRVGVSKRKPVDGVRYASLDFVGESFRSNLMASWNEAMGDRIALVDPVPSPELQIYDENLLYLTNNLAASDLGVEAREALLRGKEADALAFLSGTIYPWEQKFEGQLQVVGRSNRVLWKQKIVCVSTHILKDADSPYLGDFDQMLDRIEKRPRHRDEILVVVGELGSQVAASAERAWNLFLPPSTNRASVSPNRSP